MTEKRHIGKRVAEFRKAMGMRTAADLAERSGLTKSVVQNIEAGRRQDLTISQLMRISSAIGIAPIFFLFDLHKPGATVDLPALPDELASMTGAEFEVWVSGETWFHLGRSSIENDALGDLRNTLHGYMRMSIYHSDALMKAASIRRWGEASPFYDDRMLYGERDLEFSWTQLETFRDKLLARGVDLASIPGPQLFDEDGGRLTVGGDNDG